MFAMAEPNRPDCQESQKRISRIESKITEHSATQALERLAQAGCARSILIRTLGFSCGLPTEFLFDDWFTKPGPKSISGLFGVNGRGFSKLKRRLRQSADSVDGINRRFEFGVLLTAPNLTFLQALPNLLRGYVSLLDLAAERLGRGAHQYHNVGKGILTLFVKSRTGQYYDAEVSAILGAVCNKEGYSAANHSDWREEHKDLLDRLSPFIEIFASESVRAKVEAIFASRPTGVLDRRGAH